MIKKKKKVKTSAGTNLNTMRRVFAGIEGSAKFWKPATGENLIRILPSNREDGAFAFKTHMHHGFKLEGRNRAFPCLSGAFKKPCPVCQVISYHDTDTDSDVKAALQTLRPQNQFMFNIIDRRDETGTVKIYSSTVPVAREINNLINDEDYGDITDPETGRDIKITATGEGKQRRYSVRGRTKESAINVEDWEDNLFNLEKEAYIEIPTYKKYISYLDENYGDILDINGALGLEKDEEEEEEKDEEEEEVIERKARKTKKVLKKKPVKKISKKKVEEEEEEEEEEREDEEEEDEDNL